MVACERNTEEEKFAHDQTVQIKQPLCNRDCSVTVTYTLMSDAAAAPDVTSSISAWTPSSFFLFTTITCSFFLLLSHVKGS